MMECQRFEGRCLSPDCKATYAEELTEPTASQRRTQIANRLLWAKTHYEIHGHHRFAFGVAVAEEVSVAEISNPDQGRIQDDENYTTEKVGGDG